MSALPSSQSAETALLDLEKTCVATYVAQDIVEMLAIGVGDEDLANHLVVLCESEGDGESLGLTLTAESPQGVVAEKG